MKLKGLLTAAFAAATLASPLAAEDLNFDSYCVLGSFQVCASVQVYSSGNTLRMRVWNLDDVLGTSYTMTAIGLYQSGTPWSGTVNSYTVNYNGTDITSKWTSNGGNDIKTLGGVNLAIQEGTKGNAGIIGCTDPGGSPDKWATCNSFPVQPYVEFNFNLSQNFSLDKAELRWHAQQVGPNSISLKCDTGGLAENECVETTTTTTVTPEPVSMILLGSGLAGVGAAALRRRRKNGQPVQTEA